MSDFSQATIRRQFLTEILHTESKRNCCCHAHRPERMRGDSRDCMLWSSYKMTSFKTFCRKHVTKVLRDIAGTTRGHLLNGMPQGSTSHGCHDKASNFKDGRAQKVSLSIYGCPQGSLLYVSLNISLELIKGK